MFRLILSATIGSLIGKERQRHNDSGGGSRTMAIICIASCFIAILSLEMVKSGYKFDFVRIFSYMLPAIGFIGMAMVNKTKTGVDGLTTASTLLVLLPIGFAIGLGYFFYGIITGIIVYIILESKYWKNQGEK